MSKFRKTRTVKLRYNEFPVITNKRKLIPYYTNHHGHNGYIEQIINVCYITEFGCTFNDALLHNNKLKALTNNMITSTHY